MIKIAICTLLVVLFVQSGKTEQQQQIDFEEFFNNAKKYFDGWTKDVREKVGLSENPSGAEIVRVFKEHNKKVADDLNNAMKKIDEEMKSNPNLQSILQQIKSKFNEEADKLKKSSPDIATNVENLGKSLQGSWNSISQEIEKGVKEFNKAGGKREELEKNFENLIDQMKKGAKDLEAKVVELQKKQSR